MKRKNTIYVVIIMTISVILPKQASAQNDGSVGIGTSRPDPSAIIDATSTTKGFLPPRMSKSQRDAIRGAAEGLLISCTDCEVVGLHQYINELWQPLLTNHQNRAGDYGTVVNPATGKVWLDRNLGASQVATSPADAASYGDLYQWGRGADGHQDRLSETTNTIANNWLSGTSSGKFITGGSNWQNTGDTHMWSGTAGENNPCPSGFRVPTNAEWEQERLTWSPSNDAIGAFNSPLKLPMSGYRDDGGSVFFEGSRGLYWSSTVSGQGSRRLEFSNGDAILGFAFRNLGYSIRCIKD